MTQQRRIVYFLGAGASVASGAHATVQHGGKIPAPTQENFWGTFLRFCQWTENYKIIESFLFRYFLGYGKVPTRLRLMERLALLNEIEVEEVFTFISERIAAPATSPQLKVAVEKVWAALTAEIGTVFSKFPANADSRKLYRKFLDQHVRSRDTIVSFNYDTIFEESIHSYQRFYYDGLQARARGEIRVLKPHGSVNWSLSKKFIRVERAPKRSVIVAPTHLKFVGNNNGGIADTYGYLNQTNEMPKIWASMEGQMRGAKALVFIGYSFPVADLYFSSVLRSIIAARNSQPKIVVVNPDALAISARIKKRFALEEVQTYFDFRQFNQETRRN
jgi:hypothetical protein